MVNLVGDYVFFSAALLTGRWRWKLHCISYGHTLVRIHRSLLNFLPQVSFFQISVKREKCWVSKYTRRKG